MTQKQENIDVAHDESLMAQKSSALIPMEGGVPAKANLHTSVGRMKLCNIDLNNAYDDTEDCMENMEHFDAPVNVASHQDSHKASPPQTSGNSGSTSTQSPSSSSEEVSVFPSLCTCTFFVSGIILRANTTYAYCSKLCLYTHENLS